MNGLAGSVTAIDMVPRRLSGGEYSHAGSWAWLRANQLKHVGINTQVLCEKDRNINTGWAGFDTVYLFHTMDFNVEHPYLLNVFDGPQEHVAKHFERFTWAANQNIKFVSLDYPMPDYGARCKRKRDRASEGAKMSDYWKNVDWDNVQEKCEMITDWILDPGVTLLSTVTFKEFQAGIRPKVKHIHKKLVVGDSHTHSAYTPNSLVLRKDGRTMQGIIKKGIKKEITDYGFDWDQIEELSCYYGNIDIRHHFCREGDPISNVIATVDQYAEMLKRTEKTIEIVCPLPIEDESRKLPSTGHYLGTSFIGSRKDRQDALTAFWERMSFHAAANNWKTFRWPESWYKLDGLEFMDYMEKPRSVHLARKFYRWDLENDRLNPLLIQSLNKPSLLEF